MYMHAQHTAHHLHLQVDTIIAHIKARQKVLIPPKTNQMSTETAEVNIQYWFELAVCI